MHLGHDPKAAVKVAIDLSVYCEGPIITQAMHFNIKETSAGGISS